MHKNRKVLSKMDDSILELKLNYIYLQNTRGRGCTKIRGKIKNNMHKKVVKTTKNILKEGSILK